MVGAFGRGATTSLIRLRRDMNDPLVTEFFDRVDRHVVKPHIIQNSSTSRARRSRESRGYRTGPLLRIAEELGLFDHLESLQVRKRLFPTYPDFRVARANEEVTHSLSPDRKLSYTLDENGDCRFTFREWTEGSSNHGGVRSRGYGGRDANDREQAGDTLEPQVNMRKFDPATGNIVDDKRLNGELLKGEDRQPRYWRAEMVTLPLVAPV